MSVSIAGALLRQTLLGGAPSVHTEESGVAVYRDVRPGVDALVACSQGRVEEFLRIRAGCAEDFTYEMTIESTAHRFRRGHTLEVVDAAARPILRLSPPVYWVNGYEKLARAQVDVVDDRIARLTLSIPAADREHEILLDPEWTSAGSLGASRVLPGHAALPDGSVLLAGDSETGLMCERYDPGSDTWAFTGSMASPRHSPVLAELLDGRVLVSGGSFMLDPSTAACEVFDSATGVWTPTAPLFNARSGHRSTVLLDGRVLVTGGHGLTDFVTTCELYDPVTETWDTAGDLATGRTGHTATVLPDGRVLVAGGFSAGSFLASCQIYEPLTGTWSSTADFGTSRTLHSATLLTDGTVLVVGGTAGGPLSLPVSTCEIYDPGSGTWSFTGAMATPRWSGSVTRLGDGTVLVAGGRAQGSVPSSAITVASCELYDPSTGAWSPTAAMAQARRLHVAVLLIDGSVLVAGGDVFADPFACERYVP